MPHHHRHLQGLLSLITIVLTNIACQAIGARPTPTPSFAVPTPTATQRPTEAVPPTKTPEPVTMQIVGSPPDGQLYHGIYPGGPSGEEDDLTLDDLRSYEEAVGKTAAVGKLPSKVRAE